MFSFGTQFRTPKRLCRKAVAILGFGLIGLTVVTSVGKKLIVRFGLPCQSIWTDSKLHSSFLWQQSTAMLACKLQFCIWDNAAA
jgi:hypothetical protein